MRKLVAWDLMTLDGCFEGRHKWDLSFHETVWGEELEAFSLEQAAEIGTLLFGRITYEGMAAYWATAAGPIADFMNAVEKVVVSGSPLSPPWTNSRRLEGDLPQAVRNLKQGPGKDIYVFGSAELTASLMGAGLVDELRIGLAPVLLGAGEPLFKPGGGSVRLDLLEARALRTGVVILRYAPRGAGG